MAQQSLDGRGQECPSSLDQDLENSRRHRPGRGRLKSQFTMSIQSVAKALLQSTTFTFLIVLALLIAAIPGVDAAGYGNEQLSRSNLDQGFQRHIQDIHERLEERLVELGPKTTSKAHQRRKLPFLDEPRGFRMPRAFDTSLGNNFTANSCPQFFHAMLNDPDFVQCSPVSMMLQTSASFFEATKSQKDITRVLDTACSVPFEKCSSLMSSLSRRILEDNACSSDYAAGNPTVQEAVSGLIAYEPIFKATCMEHASPAEVRGAGNGYVAGTGGGGGGGEYCYAAAVTNTTSPTSSYIYYLPLGVFLPSGAMPPCNSCLRRTMAVFAQFAAHPAQPLSLTYGDAASSINIICGPSFAKAHVQVLHEGTAVGRAGPLAYALIVSVVLAVVVGWC